MTQNYVKIKLVRSSIGHPQKQRDVLRGMGLRKLNKVVTLKDTPETWGMIKKVSHLVEVVKHDVK